MIRTTKSGDYRIIETFDGTKMLVLDKVDDYAWIKAEGIGDILVASKKNFNPRTIISAGPYRIFEVKDEPDLTDLEHLELFIGDGTWQGYLLPNGLPSAVKRHRIISTKEIITRTTH